jgi:hypothetical protein
MKKSILVVLAVLVVPALYSQKLYFVYLQSEPEQPYFVRMNETVHSSSASGYLILSRLRDSVYTLNIGFPQNKWPEQKFIVEVRGKDQGYSLKNFGEKGWGLFNLETLAVQMGTPVNGNAVTRTESKDVSAFTDMLSKAANDPSLKEKPVVAKEPARPARDSVIPKKPELVTAAPPMKKEEAVQSKDSALLAKETHEPVQVSPQKLNNRPGMDSVLIQPKEVVMTPPVAIQGENSGKTDSVLVEKPVKPVEKQDTEMANKKPALVQETKTVIAEEPFHLSKITRKSESSTTKGMALTYVDDMGNGKKDTVAIFIPNTTVKTAEPSQPARDQKRFLDIATDDTVKKSVAVPREVKEDTQPAVSAKNICPSTATDADFLKLRKKMASVNGNEDMLDEARKVFRQKCFTTQQVRNLGALFLDDEGKYHFFDAAYTHVSDPGNFPSLAGEIRDEYFLNRFKAMLR